MTISSEAERYDVNLHMPDDPQKKEDDYLCSAFRVKHWIGVEPVYIRKFVTKNTDDMLHHMIIYACAGPINKQPGDVWYVL